MPLTLEKQRALHRLVVASKRAWETQHESDARLNIELAKVDAEAAAWLRLNDPDALAICAEERAVAIADTRRKS